VVEQRISNNVKIHPTVAIDLFENSGIIILKDNVEIRQNCIIRPQGGLIEIGKNTIINYYCIFHGLGNIVIGSDCLIGPCVQIYAQNHGVKKELKINKQNNTGKGIYIGHDVWLGASSIILDGSFLANGTVVGAGSVVTGKSTKAYEIWAGNPAKKIGERL